MAFMNDVIGNVSPERRAEGQLKQAIDDVLSDHPERQYVSVVDEGYRVAGKRHVELDAGKQLASTTGRMFEQYNDPSRTGEEGTVIGQKQLADTEAEVRDGLPASLDDYLFKDGVEPEAVSYCVLENEDETIHEVRHEDYWLQYAVVDGFVDSVYESALHHERIIERDHKNEQYGSIRVMDIGASTKGHDVADELDSGRLGDMMQYVPGSNPVFVDDRWRYAAETHVRDEDQARGIVDLLFRNNISFQKGDIGLLLGRKEDQV